MRRRSPSRRSRLIPRLAPSQSEIHRVELDSINERVLVDRPGVRSAPTQRLAIGLAGPPDIRPGDRRERDKLDCIDLDLTETDPVAPTLLDPWPLPQSDRERDFSRQNIAAQLAAELHTREASP